MKSNHVEFDPNSSRHAKLVDLVESLVAFFWSMFHVSKILLSGKRSTNLESRHIFNRAYPENTNFETFVPRSLKFHTFGDLHITKKC